MATIRLAINGRLYTVEADPQISLLSVLREDLDLTGTKYGCGEGQCGACTVLVEGTARRSCITRGGNMARKPITTIEGLASGETPSGAASVSRRGRDAMRVLHFGNDHDRGGAAQSKSPSHAKRDRRLPGGQHLPLRNVLRASSARSRRPRQRWQNQPDDGRPAMSDTTRISARWSPSDTNLTPATISLRSGSARFFQDPGWRRSGVFRYEVRLPGRRNPAARGASSAANPCRRKSAPGCTSARTAK